MSEPTQPTQPQASTPQAPQDTYMRVPSRRYEQLILTEQKYQQSLATILSLNAQLANVQLLIEAQAEIATPTLTDDDTLIDSPEDTLTDSTEASILEQVMSSTVEYRPNPVTTGPSPLTPNSNATDATRTPAGAVFPGGTPYLLQHNNGSSPTHVTPFPSLADRTDQLVPSLASPASQPVQRPSPVSHVDTENFVSSPVQYREMYQTCLDVIYGGKPPSTALLVTPSNISVIMNGLEMGLSRKAACALVGINQMSYSSYSAQARKLLEPYRTFIDMMEIAEARSETRLVASWQRHTQDSWQAVQAFLAKRFAQDWGDRRIIDLSATQLMEMPSEQLKSIIGEELYNALTQQAAQANTAQIIEHDPTNQPQLTDDAHGTTANGIRFDESVGYE